MDEATTEPRAPAATGRLRFRTTNLVVPLALAAVVMAPLVGGRWLLLLDWVLGPHLRLPRPLLGLDGAPAAGAPFIALVVTLARAVGPLVSWVVPTSILILAGALVARLVGGPPLRRASASLLYLINPFVYERFAVGQFAFLLGYACLPGVAAACIAGLREGGRAPWIRAALWAAVATAASPHFGWIHLVLGIALVACSLRRAGRRAAGGVASMLALSGLSNGYLFVSSASVAAFPGIEELHAYRMRGGSTAASWLHGLGLLGFWRAEPPLLDRGVAAWPIVLVALLVVGAVGYRPARRHLGAPPVAALLVAGVAGSLLALGDRGPSGAVFGALYRSLPAFSLMREPQKFLALLALLYAVVFAFGVEELARRRPSRAWHHLVPAGAALVLPLCMAPWLPWALSGRVSTSSYPRSWASADREMGAGAGQVLALPWHQYLATPFTGRVTANPASAYFRRPVIISSDPELPGAPARGSARDRYLLALFEAGPGLCTFGDLVAPLGIEYVVLLKTADWPNYAWLDRQADLERTDLGDLVLFRNTRYRGPGATGTLARIPDLDALLRASEAGGLPAPLAVGSLGPAAGARPECGSLGGARPMSAGNEVTRVSPVEYEAPRVASAVATDATSDEAWRAPGRARIPNALGTEVYGPGPPVTRIRHAGWPRLTLAYWCSGAVALVQLLAVARGRRVRNRSSPVNSGRGRHDPMT